MYSGDKKMNVTKEEEMIGGSGDLKKLEKGFIVETENERHERRRVDLKALKTLQKGYTQWFNIPFMI